MTEYPRNGNLHIDGDRATMSFRRRVPYPIEAVWAALTDPDQRASWFGETTMEPRRGGMIEMLPSEPPVPPDVKRMTGRILVWEPPAAGRTAVLEHEWNQRIVEESVVRYELVADGEATILTFTHSGLSARNAKGFIPGTHAYLDRLEAQLAGEPVPLWSTRYDEVAPAYA
ncbi:SRPBCC family protein [Amycolatopsis palatopharyngis]|uniref:SRPBCC family protein n=1 Tax=Amycolatopsis palatopharyngis TaxID=187982 RepID=UPI000E23C69A|nr:SRPBCC family protein [Amycolatopsis palatopharyngis]